ncbi:outer membrane beta-barrel protein [Vibrio sp. OPT18]|uniref:outer membrane beta-barrel protein n=1 Tax=Vibrio sp. OPT18 TaxID=2778641 RepID=UPI0018829082|nr:outer membrane beta-barrel protein [Vibrio sp. OPT18]MBE8575033.1 porin family protein [Vibrio sp. OPT18]
MKKTIIALSTLALASTSVSAFDLNPEFFVGGGVGYHHAKFEYKFNDVDEVDGNASGKESNTAKGAAFSVRTGAYLTPNHRVTLTANFTGDNELYKDSYGDLDELKQSEYLASYDYFHYLNSEFSLFGGVTAGIVQNKHTVSWDEEGDSGKETNKETDFTYGLQVGAQYKINTNWSADLQYRHMFESSSVSESDSWDTGYYKDTYTVKNHGELTLSVDYRF